MAEFRDCMGLPVTCASEEALRLYNEMLLVDISLWESALPLVRAVLELEPRFVLAHCVLVGIYLQIARLRKRYNFITGHTGLHVAL